MQFDKKIGLIRKLLKKKKESPIIELQIKDYNKSNFYISLLYNRTIDKFKVLYIPLDVVEDNKIEEYCCYQFMEVKSIIYITEQIKKELPKYEELVSRDNRNKHINNFIIEIDVYMNKKKYDFYATRYLPKRWEFLFESIVMLFEHCPNIMNELATEILSVIMNTNESIEYQASLNCDLDTMNLKNYFPFLQDEKALKEKKIDYLEYVNGKWNDSSLPYGAHNDNSSYDDIWSAIQEQISDRWFVPSKSEWASFGATFNITSGNYSNTYGLSRNYWSSSQYNTYTAYGAIFYSAFIY